LQRRFSLAVEIPIFAILLIVLGGIISSRMLEAKLLMKRHEGSSAPGEL
jgi:hypothetical protein